MVSLIAFTKVICPLHVRLMCRIRSALVTIGRYLYNGVDMFNLLLRSCAISANAMALHSYRKLDGLSQLFLLDRVHWIIVVVLFVTLGLITILGFKT